MGDFADFNLDELLNSPSGCQPICIPQSSGKRSRLAERIAESDELIRQVKHLQGERQQLADLQRTAQEVTDLYQHEKKQRLELEQQANEFGERCKSLEKQLDAQVLNCESLQEELTTRGLPVDAKDLVEVFMQLAQRAGEDIGLMRREQNMIKKLKDFCKMAKINMPTAKSQTPNNGSCRRKGFGTLGDLRTSKATQTNEAVIPKRPEMCSMGVQVGMRVEMQDQGTQHKNTTTTRGTTTASFITYQDAGTCFPEPKPKLSVRQILDEMLSWHDPQVIKPISPISDSMLPADTQPYTFVTSSVGTCTTLCNVQREIDFVSINLPTQIKVSNSRPPSRAMFDSVKDEANFASHHVREMLSFLPRPELPSCLSNVPAHAFEELWQVFGQMVLGLLQRRSNASQTTQPNYSQADFANWLYALYEGTQLQEQQMPRHNEKACKDRMGDESTACEDPGITSDQSSENLHVDLRPILLPAKNYHRERESKKQKRKGKTNWRGNSKKRRKRTDYMEASEMVCDIRKRMEPLYTQEEHIALEHPPQRGVYLDSAKECLLKSCSVFDPAITCTVINNECEAAPLKPIEELQQLLIPSIEKSQNEAGAGSLDVAKSFDNTANGAQTKTIEQLTEFPRISHIDRVAAVPSKKSQNETTLPYLNKNPQMAPEPSGLQCEQSGNCCDASPIQKSLHSECAIQFLTNLNSFNVSNCDNLELLLNEEELRLLQLTREQTKISPCKTKERNTNESFQEKIESFSNVDAETILQITDATEVSDSLKLALFGSDSESEDLPLEPLKDTVDAVSEDDMISEPGILIIDEEEMSSSQSATPTSSPSLSSSPPSAKRKSNRSKSKSPLVCEFRITRQRAKQLLEEQTIQEENTTEMPKKETSEEEPKKYSNSFLEESPTSPSPTSAAEDCVEMPKKETSEEEPKKYSNSFLEESPTSPNPTPAEEDCVSYKCPIEIPLERAPILHQEPTSLLKHVIAITKAEVREQKKKKNYTPPIFDALRPKIVEYLMNGPDLESTCRDFGNALQRITKDEPILIEALINTISQMDQSSHTAQEIERLIKAVHYLSTTTFITIIQNFMNALENRLIKIGNENALKTNIALKFVKVYLKLIQLQSSLSQEVYVNPARLLIVKILYHYDRDMPVLVLEVLTEFPTVLPHREERSYDNSDPIITVIKHLLMNRRYDVHDPQGAERTLLSKLRFEYHFQPYEPTRQQVVQNLVEKLKDGKLQQDLTYAFALFCRRGYLHHLQVVNEILGNHLMPLACSYCNLSTQCEDYDDRLQALLQCISMIVRELPLDTDVSGYIVLFKHLLMAVTRPGVQEAAVQAILRLQKFGFNYALDALQNYTPNYTLTPLTRAMMCSFAVRREKYHRPQ
ncbi:little elongation complex subunit 1 [Drosophila tropicalis]|uniref:little elongation complex subunit 1 n=1 Tax=Drosophila tropicalis TaxID=46794 RepID=UPI0035ABBE1C